MLRFVIRPALGEASNRGSLRGSLRGSFRGSFRGSDRSNHRLHTLQSWHHAVIACHSFPAPRQRFLEDRYLSILTVILSCASGFANFTPAMWRGYSKWHQQSKMPVGNWVTTSPTGISMEALGSYAGGYSQGCTSSNPSGPAHPLSPLSSPISALPAVETHGSVVL